MRTEALKKIAEPFVDPTSDVPVDVQKMDPNSYPVPMPGNWLSAIVGADPKDWKFEEWKSFPGYARAALPTIDTKAFKQTALDSFNPTNTDFRAYMATNAFPKVNKAFLNRYMDATYDALQHIKDDDVGMFSAGRVFDKFKKKFRSSMDASEKLKPVQIVKSSQALEAPKLRGTHPTLAVGRTDYQPLTAPHLRKAKPTAAKVPMPKPPKVPAVTPPKPPTPPVKTMPTATPAAKPATPVKPVKPAFSFSSEALKVLRPFSNDFKQNRGAYSDQAVTRVNQMMAQMNRQYKDMKANPQKYTEQQKRAIIGQWKAQINSVQRWRPGESRTVGKNVPNPNDPKAGWQQVGRGISIIPRTAAPNASAQQRRYAAADQKMAKRWRMMQIADEMIANGQTY